MPPSSARHFLQDILPNEDVVLYVDADTLFLHPVEDLLEAFEKMNERHLMALVHDIEDEATNWYHQHGKTPFIPPFGTYGHASLLKKKAIYIGCPTSPGDFGHPKRP